MLLHLVIPFKLICNMTCSKKLILTYWPHRVHGVWGQNICYNVAAFVILFNLISNMTMYWKKTDLLPTDPIHRVGGVGGGGGGGGSSDKIFATMLLHSWFSLILICDMTMFWKSWISTYWLFPGSGQVGRHLRANICCLAAAFSDFL